MTNSNLLDAWDDFAKITSTLSDSSQSIVICLGASWCHKCEPVKKTIFQLSEVTPSNTHWLWLDLEDHCEFLGTFFPETIPLVWVYQGSHLVRHGQPELTEKIATPNFVEFIQSIPIAPDQHTALDLRPTLIKANCAA